MTSGSQYQRRSRWPVVMIVLGLVAGVGAGGVWLVSQSKRNPQPAAQPTDPDTPEVSPVPTAVPMDGDETTDAAVQPAAIVDAGLPDAAVDAAPEPPDAAAKRNARNTDRRNTGRRNAGRRDRGKPDAAPLSDDELFDTRK